MVRRGNKRNGSVALLGLVGLMFLSVVFLALVNYCWVWTMRVQLQNAADAASLATVQAFANDVLLVGTEPGLSENFLASREVGVEYADAALLRSEHAGNQVEQGRFART